MRGWNARQWAAAPAAAVLAAAVIGIPTGIIRTPFYHRMTPVLWWNYPVWAATAVLEGFLLASYVRTGTVGRASTGKATAGGCCRSWLSAARSATSWWCSPLGSAGHCPTGHRSSHSLPWPRLRCSRSPAAARAAELPSALSHRRPAQ